MIFPFLIFGAISISLVKLSALIVWVKVLAAIVKLAMLAIGLLTLTFLWRTFRRRR